MLKARFAADDWGLSPAVNEAILELAEAGILRSVSLFANLPFTELGLERLRQTNTGLSAHLNFTLGRPLLPAKTLTKGDGSFFTFGEFVKLGIRGRLDSEEIFRETEAQLKRLKNLVPIESVNGHQHVHFLPWMVDPVSRACSKAGISRIRKMVDAVHPASALMSFWSARSYARALPGVEWERTAYLWPTGRLGASQIRRKLSRSGDLPLLIHPATSDDFAQQEFSDELRSPRVKEYRQLRELIP